MPDLISRSGAGYLFSGLQCLRDPRLRPYLLLPLGLNLLLFVVVSSLLLSSFAPLMASLMASLPAWLGWIDWLLWPLFALTILLAYGYLFNSLAAILGAPFYGLLAQQVQRQAGGPPLPDETFSQTLRRTLAREWEKLRYLLPRSAAIGVLFFFTFWIPLVNLITSLVVFVWGAWVLCIQYSDYSADNNQQAFTQLRQQLAQHPLQSIAFGGLCLLAGMVPLLNLLVMPAAVAGGTLYWLAQQNPPAAAPSKDLR